MEKTQEVASQIKYDTPQIILDIETVVIILEYQMDRISDKIEEVENYTKRLRKMAEQLYVQNTLYQE